MENLVINLWETFCTPENWSLDNILTIISLLFALCGGIFALRQWIVSIKVRRTEFLNQCIDKIRTNKDFRKVFYAIEYDKFIYGSAFHDSSAEQKMDHFLSYLSFICYLYDIGNLTSKDMLALQYYLNRTCSSYEVQCYLWNVYHFAKSKDYECSFMHLIHYGFAQNLIPRDVFLSKKPIYYKKRTNW